MPATVTLVTPVANDVAHAACLEHTSTSPLPRPSRNQRPRNNMSDPFYGLRCEPITQRCGQERL